MQKITAQSPEALSADIVAENVEQLKALFPEAVVEGKIDFEVLKQLLGGVVEEREEKYGLNWHGKRRARQLALTPSTGTLRPCPEESVNWDTTQNLMIEGDNLEVLKLLQKSYAGKVKLIYIDPPYNTGNDFVYPDNFQDNIKNYLELTGQVAGGQKLTSNTEASGRFHTDWLNMMYPRLKLARNLLRRDGIIFISIDDGELPRLRNAADDIFGEENFLASFIWKSRQNKDNRTVTGASVDHEYIICYGNSIRGATRDRSQYTNPDGDSRGDWTSANMVGIATADRRPNLHYDLINPETDINYGCPSMGWRYEPKTMARLISEKRIIWPASAEGRPRRKAFISELDSDFTGFSTIIGDGIFTRDGTSDIDDLFDTRIFSFPKPVSLISNFVEQGSERDDIVLDFFAGSGTTGHAVMVQNIVNQNNRRYILVQLPEPLDINNRDQKTAADFCEKLGKPNTIAELTKERLRRAGQKIKTENPLFPGDTGFRVFKLDSSNIRAWEPDRENLQQSLLDTIDHIKPGRSEADLLHELLLKLGLDLCVPIEQRDLAGKTVHAIGGGVLLACLTEKIGRDEVESLAMGIINWHKELAPVGDSTCVFRDSAFNDDVAKTNLEAILNQHGLCNVRSL
ncbi:MAG: site-specific DNA-methyltransferase [Desulfobulbus sp.]|nr:site-specific DNA-methyltransferase [Desulfobulbus sp.]